jgi:hypothetical protein
MQIAKKLWQNRKEKERTRRLQSEDPGLEVVHPHAAGIGVGKKPYLREKWKAKVEVKS